MVAVLRSRMPQGEPGEVIVALAEESEHLNGHRPTANGNGSSHRVELGEESGGNDRSASG
jgi:hypothetical protein